METNEKNSKYFEAIKRNNVAEINKFFKDPSISPWEFIEDEGNTGTLKHSSNKVYTVQSTWTFP